MAGKLAKRSVYPSRDLSYSRRLVLSSRRLVSLSLGSELIRACPSSGSSFAFVGRDFPGNFTVTVPIRPRPRSALYALLESVSLPHSPNPRPKQDTHTNTERERKTQSEQIITSIL